MGALNLCLSSATTAKDNPTQIETQRQAIITARHILILFHDFSPGGTEIVALKLAREWVNAGRKVTILCGNIDGALSSQVPSGVNIVVLSPEIRRSPLSRLNMRRVLPDAIDRIVPDIVYIPGNFHLVLAGGARNAGTQPLVVAKISNPLSPAGQPCVIRWLTSLAFRKTAREADWLVAMSRGLMTDVRQAIGQANVSVILDPNTEARQPGVASRQPALESGKIRLLAAGRLVAQKDFALAIRVTSALAQTHDVHLTILGEGPKRKQLKRVAARHRIGDRVTMPGHAPSIIPALADADALLVTSLYEGGPAVAVEALEHGVPVIATDCSHFLRDLLAQPGCGTIVESRDAASIAAVVKSVLNSLKDALPDTARPDTASMTNAYRTDVSADNYLRLFDRLVTERRLAREHHKPGHR